MKLIPLGEVKAWPEPREYTAEEIAEALRLGRESFTINDLVECLNLDESNTFDCEEVMAELEAVQKQFDEKNNGGIQ